jgi:hypothetical protein
MKKNKHHKFKYENSPQIQWQTIIQLVVVLMTILGSTIPLYMHTDAKLEIALQGIREDMRDFHGRLCAIEERNRK